MHPQSVVAIRGKGYRNQVLSGQLSGRGLVDGLKPVVSAAKQSADFQDTKIAHRFLMWHLAHCPSATGQQAVFELALDFESSLEGFKSRFFGNSFPPMAMVLERSE